MGKLVVVCITAAVFLFSGSLALANFSTIQDATSGSEIDLWQALDLVAANPFGASTSWQSTAFLNAGAGGLRLDDNIESALEWRRRRNFHGDPLLGWKCNSQRHTRPVIRL